MKLEIVEKSNTKPFESMPITYRVSMRVNNGTVTLQREYFRCGFYDGEQYDDFYFDNEGYHRGSPLCHCSFITKRIDDKVYLMKKEEEMIKLFYEKCVKSKKGLEKELRRTTKELNDNISNYEDIINYFEYTQRGDKLKKLKSKIK